MSFSKNISDDEKQRELEIEEILEETHYLADKEKMEKTAQKYRAKPKMDEIFSNTSKKPRLKNDNPLDVDDVVQAEEVTPTSIVGEKTAATIQASLIMDGEDIAKPSLASNNDENNETEKECEEIVTLSPEYSEGTLFSNEVIDEVEQFDDSAIKIEDINSIDISLEEKPTEDTQKQAKANENFTEKSNAKRVVARVPVYKPDTPRNILNVKAGKFSEVVAEEYEEYIKSKNPSILAHVLKQEPKQEEPEEDKPEDTRSTGEKILQAVVGFFSRDESDDNDMPQEKSKPVEDYTGKEDEKSILFELNHNIKKLFGKTFISGAIALVSVILTVITRLFPDFLCSAISFAPVAYAILNFLLVGFSVFINRVTVLSGLTPLVKLKGNSDTALAVGAVAAVIQTIASFFCISDLDSFNINYYCVVVLLAFFAGNLGKLLMVLRVKANFRFVSSKGQKYAAKIYNNESVATQMMSGTAVDKPIIAYQHKTDFPANFLKISYAPDPSEDLASKLSPITTIAAILISIMYGFAKTSFAGALNAFALITAISIPISTMLSVNYPVYKLCKKLLGFGAMLSGYPSIKQFCDSTAVMIDANELFPEDAIELEGIKTYEDYGVDESLLCGIAILKEAKNPIAKVFDSVVAESSEKLPDVESVLYEDELGLVGWINSERILVGSKTLMEKYNVEIPKNDYSDRYTEKGSQVTYVSRAGRLVAMFVTRYRADSQIKAEIQRAEANGISFLIRTTDYNVTNDLVADLFDVFYRSVKVLPTGLGNVLKEAQTTHEETSRSYLITGGKISSLSRAVSACVKIKHNISLSIVIQLIAVILGILLSSTLVLYAGVGVMGTLEVLIYSLFWGIAAVVAPAFQKP